MKILRQFLKFSAMTVFCGILLLSCESGDPDAEQEPPSDTLAVEDLDNLSDHLQFVSATKNEGKAPSASGSSSLKFSIKDTLHLLEGVFMPVEFLHDELTNVVGAYIQVRHFSGSTNTVIEATYHYDVPELPDAAESDSVSIIMVGVDPEGLVEGVPPAGSPFTFEIAIVPYDPNGQPLDVTVVPVIIEDISDDHPNSSGSCGFVLPEGEYWYWDLSYIPSNPWDGEFIFFNAPSVIHGGDQIIKGCCVDGESYYAGECLIGTPEEILLKERSLPFSTYYQIAAETFVFKDNGTYTRHTREISANPEPMESDFCNGTKGNVVENITDIIYGGNWTIQNISIPPGYLANPLLVDIDYTTRDNLSLQSTSSSSPGGGYLNPGGIVHELSCDGFVLIQLDREGSGQHLYKFYSRGEVWYPLS